MKALWKKRIAVILASLATIGTVVYLLQRPAIDRPEIRRVLLISIDTCRADHIGCYGFDKPITPNIDALAAESVVFQQCISPVPLTLPAHSSMLTGCIPPHHGVHANHDYTLHTDNITLAEILRDEGFTTGAIVSAFVLDSQFGLNQGFDTYDDEFPEDSENGPTRERKGERTSRLAVEWLERNRDESFFLFLHYFDPHQEYEPPEPFASQYSTDLYAGEIASTDHCIGIVVEKLKELQLYDSTLVILTADHGEMLGEHNEATHGFFIYQGSLHVPLVFKLPGQSVARRHENRVGIVDIVPTICGLIDRAPPSAVQGNDLSPFLWSDHVDAPERTIYCECMTPTIYGANSLSGLVTDRWKFIRTTRPELYDLIDDPGETRNLVQSDFEQAHRLDEKLEDILDQQSRKLTTGNIETDAQTLRRLAALGYVGGSVSEDVEVDQDKDDPKDIIDFHRMDARVTVMIPRGQLDEAKRLCRQLLQQRPNYSQGYLHLALIAEKQDDVGEAIRQYREFLQLNPDRAGVECDLGLALMKQGSVSDGIERFRRAIEIKPDFALAHYNLGTAQQSHNQLEQAAESYQSALRIQADYYDALHNLGTIRIKQDDFEQAIPHLQQALKLRPDAVASLSALCVALNGSGRSREAVPLFRRAIELQPSNPGLLNGLAWILSTNSSDQVRDGEEALRLAQRACELTQMRNMAALGTLAAAYAEVGRFNDAIALTDKIISTVPSPGRTDLVTQMQERREQYQRGQPFRE